MTSEKDGGLCRILDATIRKCMEIRFQTLKERLLIMADKTKPVCTECKGRGTVRVLGGGGDFEDWPCPKCRQLEYDQAVYGNCRGGGNDDEAE